MLTHLCAPGFFFLMGTGMALFAGSRRRAGWSEGRIASYFAKRGLLLLAINQVIENPAWVLGILSGRMDGAGETLPGSGGIPFVIFGVITGLAFSILASALLLRFGNAVWWAAAVIALLASAWFTPGPENALVAYPLWERLLYLPGQSGHAVVLYPFVPWFGIAALGTLFGRWVERAGDKAISLAPMLGVAMIAAAILLRAAGGFGNLRLPREGSWIEFFNLITYPPALVFTLLFVGVDLVLLRVVKGEWLKVFGQAPLMFYLAHLYLFAAIGAAFFRNGAELWALYAVWAVGLVPLYFACRRYRAFKMSKPADSLWRFF
jgi:uncharacterized membrane protein